MKSSVSDDHTGKCDVGNEEPIFLSINQLVMEQKKDNKIIFLIMYYR